MKKIRKTWYPECMEKYENLRSAMISYGDGFRPVSFYLEILAEDVE